MRWRIDRIAQDDVRSVSVRDSITDGIFGNDRRLLSQLRERRVDPPQHRALSERRKQPPCLDQMLKRKDTLFLNFVKQPKRHLHAAYMVPCRMKMRILQHESR